GRIALFRCPSHRTQSSFNEKNVVHQTGWRADRTAHQLELLLQPRPEPLPVRRFYSCGMDRAQVVGNLALLPNPDQAWLVAKLAKQLEDLFRDGVYCLVRLTSQQNVAYAPHRERMVD